MRLTRPRAKATPGGQNAGPEKREKMAGKETEKETRKKERKKEKKKERKIR